MLEQLNSNLDHQQQLTSTLATIPVVTIANDNYAMPLAAMICSVLEHLSPNYRIHFFVLGDGVSAEKQHKILSHLDPNRCEIDWICPSNDSLKQLKLTAHFVTAVYYRLLISDLLPDCFDKVIYLDSDLVVTEDLAKLWQHDIGDWYLMAVQEIGHPLVSMGLLNYQELGIPGDYKYFNAGVLLINFKKWREDGIGNKVIEYVSQHGEYIRWPDQDGLNAVLAGQWAELDPRWNQTPAIYRCASWQDSPFPEDVFDRLVNAPYIVHFASGFKPWSSYRHRSQKIFYHYLDKTAWKGWRYPLWKAIQRRLTQSLSKQKRQ